MNTFVLKQKEITRKTHLVDAKGKVLGRMATQVATLLMGKHKPEYTPFLDCGDQVVIINAREVRFTGKKLKQKIYTHYTGYPGGIREQSLEELMEEKPDEVVLGAVRKMLPHTNLGRKMLGHLRVYPGPEHGQKAQKPVPFLLEGERNKKS